MLTPSRQSVFKDNSNARYNAMEKQKRAFTWVDYRWKEAINLFTETNKITDDFEALWLCNTTAIVAERFAMFSFNKAWAKVV